MKTVTVGLTSLILLLSCSVRPLESNTLAQYLQENDLLAPNKLLLEARNVNASEDFIQLEFEKKGVVKIIRIDFKSSASALEHMVSRRAMLSSFYKSFVEPYYGLVEEKTCVSQSVFDADFKRSDTNDVSFSVTLPSDSYFNLFDCDKGLPSYFVNYHFLLCSEKNSVYETRAYLPVSRGTEPFMALQLTCKSRDVSSRDSFLKIQ